MTINLAFKAARRLAPFERHTAARQRRLSKSLFPRELKATYAAASWRRAGRAALLREQHTFRSLKRATSDKRKASKKSTLAREVLVPCMVSYTKKNTPPLLRPNQQGALNTVHHLSTQILRVETFTPALPKVGVL